MMDAIKQKLARAFAGPLDSEMEVVYVLVEIRKYLEQNRELHKKYPALNFYCCWALHSEAAGHGADRVLERLDRRYPLMKSGLGAAQSEEIFHTLTLGKFKEELINFLNTIGISSPIEISSAHWLKFLRVYAAITEYCPFFLSSNSRIELQNIDSITVETLSLRMQLRVKRSSRRSGSYERDQRFWPNTTSHLAIRPCGPDESWGSDQNRTEIGPAVAEPHKYKRFRVMTKVC